MAGRFFRFLRIALAAISLVATVGAVIIPTWGFCFGWIPRCQLVPAIMAGSVSILIGLTVLTALFGRYYCSVLCPLGIVQDLFRFILIRWLPKRVIRPASCFAKALRLVLLVLFAMGAFFGLAGLIEPYGIFGRFLSLVIMRVGEPTVVMLIWSASPLALILALSCVSARWWCNYICPVGTFLGLSSRWSLFHVRIDEGKCVKCGLCARSCDKGALTVKADKTIAVDPSRCVVCANCIGTCFTSALKWH